MVAMGQLLLIEAGSDESGSPLIAAKLACRGNRHRMCRFMAHPRCAPFCERMILPCPRPSRLDDQRLELAAQNAGGLLGNFPGNYLL
jgi:hypothetical protein